MPRRLFTLFSAASLLLFLSLLVMWNRSRRHQDELCTLTLGTHFTQVHSLHGAFHLYWTWNMPQNPDDYRAHWEKSTMADMLRTWDGFGVCPSLCLQLPVVKHFPPGRTHVGSSQCLLPYWLPATATLILPAVGFLRITHHCRRQKLGLCPTCSYDLRASKDICPECGSPIPQITNNK